MIKFKSEIAAELNVSRATMTRLLQKARKEIGLNTGKRKGLYLGEFKQLVDFFDTKGLIPETGTYKRLAQAFSAIDQAPENEDNKKLLAVFTENNIGNPNILAHS